MDLVDVERVEVAEQPGRENEVRFGDGEGRAERLADLDLVVVLAREHRAILAEHIRTGKEAAAAIDFASRANRARRRRSSTPTSAPPPRTGCASRLRTRVLR